MKVLEARTIQEQCTVLNHLEVLENKFQEISLEKEALEARLRDQEDCRARYEKLEEEHRRVKGVAEAMVDMMYKCEKVEGSLHDAWRWLKRVVWEYEGIRKKALEWKEVYDEVATAMAKDQP